jgi:shikimate kinase/3-dehydroquinate synthase
MSARGDTWVLAGPPGVGKSSVARALGARGCDAVDLDALVEVDAHARPAELLRTRGEPALRAAEAAALARLGQAAPRPGVLALGGGTLTHAASRSAARALGVVVGLDAPIDVLEGRTVGGDRPLLAGGLAPLVAARRATYAAVDRVVDARGPLEQVADAVTSAVHETRVMVVPVGARTTRIVIGHGLVDALVGAVSHLAPRRPVVVLAEPGVPGVDARIAALEARFDVLRPPVVGGEAQKTWGALGDALAWLGDHGAGRQSVVVGLGGGSMLDFAAMVAGLLGRGAPMVAVPTTLLAQIDASLGGKAAVNVGAKNAVGLFWPADELIVDLDFLGTLSARERRAGLAEVVKSAVIGDPSLFAALETRAEDAPPDVELVAQTLAVKARHVTADPYDRGVRLHLNLGHTLGHALESAGLGLNHGEAISIGVATIARLSAARGYTSAETARRIVGVLRRLGLPTSVRLDRLDHALPLVRRDKKADQAALDLVVVRDVGNVDTVRLQQAEALDALRAAGGES